MKTIYMVMLVVVLIASFSSIAFADDKEGSYSHQHITATWYHGLICGDHKCAPGETPEPPKAVPPVRGK